MRSDSSLASQPRLWDEVPIHQAISLSRSAMSDTTSASQFQARCGLHSTDQNRGSGYAVHWAALGQRSIDSV